MIHKLSDILLVSDMDGTLLEAEKGMPLFNQEAIWRFTEKGGKFTVATGRPPSSAHIFTQNLPMKIPSIHYNGACIYHFQEQKSLETKYLSTCSKKYVPLILDQFPQIGAVILQEKCYISIADPCAYSLIHPPAVPVVSGTREDLKHDCFKILFCASPHLLLEVEEFIKTIQIKEAVFVKSCPYFLEMMAEGVDKFSAVKTITDTLNIPLENVVAIGDYFNDISMIQGVGLGVTVAEAPQEVKSVAKMVMGPCMDGAVGHLIEFLEKKYDF